MYKRVKLASIDLLMCTANLWEYRLDHENDQVDECEREKDATADVGDYSSPDRSLLQYRWIEKGESHGLALFM